MDTDSTSKGLETVENPADPTAEQKQNKMTQRVLIKKLYGVPNVRGGTTWLENCPEHLRKTSSDSPEHPLVLRYKEAESETAQRALYLHSLVVHSPYLKDLVRRLFGRYPGVSSDEEEPSFKATFQPFFHQWAMLVRESVTPPCEDLEALISVLRDELGGIMKDAKNLARNGDITFDFLWTLFPPGCPVICQLNQKQHLFLVHDATLKMNDTGPILDVELLGLDYDGDEHGWRKMSRPIPAFIGIMSIAELPVVPLQFQEHPWNVVEALLTRGRSALALLKDPCAYKAYEGRIHLHGSPSSSGASGGVERYIEGRIVVDAKGHSQQAYEHAPYVSRGPRRLQSLLGKDSQSTPYGAAEKESQNQVLRTIMDNLNDHPVLSEGNGKFKNLDQATSAASLGRHQWTTIMFGIQPEAFFRSVIRGYCLTSKSWADFEVENIRDIQWNQKAFEALVIPPARKRFLEALVKQQQGYKSDSDLDDVIQGKGQGLILLLTGPPGTGKTLTAESIADRLHLPLYAVSAAELGDTVSEIENQFGQILRLASSWNAVLLLDEADAFLEKRVDDPGARDRNKRVAAFLRILEYYKGLLVFTTNRIVSFDDAMYSRIHLTLPFKPLDHEARTAIWRNFLRSDVISAEDLHEFASVDLNGRQVKNVMKMARLLAKDEDVGLNAGHIRDVLHVMMEDDESFNAHA